MTSRINKKIIALLFVLFVAIAIMPTSGAAQGTVTLGQLQIQIQQLQKQISTLIALIQSREIINHAPAIHRVKTDCQYSSCKAGANGCNVICDGLLWSTPNVILSKCVYDGDLLLATDVSGKNYETNCKIIEPVDDQTCAKDGEVIYPNNDEFTNKPRKCCYGLSANHAIKNCDSDGNCANDGTQICANCGNGVCGAGENAFNCSQDCKSCARQGDFKYKGNYYGGADLECCFGLKEVALAKSDRGQCVPNLSKTICIVCGDGICGKGEDNCNCPQDCNGVSICGKSYSQKPSAYEQTTCENAGGKVTAGGSVVGTYYCQCCQDTDNGKSYYTAGTVKVTGGRIDTYSDSCLGNVLREWYCDSGNNAQSATINCPNRCGSGACNY